jgi:hypothetical protein
MQFSYCTSIFTGRPRTSMLTFLGAVLLVLFWGTVEQALALQVHPEPEGLYSHQIAHLFFILSMAVMVFWLHKRGLIREPGWRLIQWGCIMFIVWNAAAFIGHAVEAEMTEESFVGKGWSRALLVQGLVSPVIYLLLKMDHLTCVPAILFLFLGLRKIRQRAEAP